MGKLKNLISDDKDLKPKDLTFSYIQAVQNLYLREKKRSKTNVITFTMNEIMYDALMSAIDVVDRRVRK